MTTAFKNPEEKLTSEAYLEKHGILPVWFAKKTPKNDNELAFGISVFSSGFQLHHFSKEAFDDLSFTHPEAERTVSSLRKLNMHKVEDVVKLIHAMKKVGYGGYIADKGKWVSVEPIVNAVEQKRRTDLPKTENAKEFLALYNKYSSANDDTMCALIKTKLSESPDVAFCQIPLRSSPEEIARTATRLSEYTAAVGSKGIKSAAHVTTEEDVVTLVSTDLTEKQFVALLRRVEAEALRQRPAPEI